MMSAPTGLPRPSEPPNRGRRFTSLQRVYVAAAVMFFNTVVVYLLINLVLGAAFLIRDRFRRESNPVSQTYGPRLDQVYPDLPEPQRTELLSESWNRPYRYADFIHFQERPFAGKYVNVSEHGFRHSVNQGPWPISDDNFNVFCFGGSTLFGYGVADDQTVASYLQQALSKIESRRVCVYNFGVGWHYSTQERLRFEQLLAGNIVPDVALFLDGINDSTQACLNRPAFSPQMSVAFEKVQAFGNQSPSQAATSHGADLAEALFFRWPIGRFVQRFAPVRQSAAPEMVIITPEQAAHSSAVYRWNRTLISAAAKAKGVIEIFVVQPSPGYKLDRKKHPLWDLDPNVKEEHFYVALRRDLDLHTPGDHLLWCADLPDQAEGPLYVDACHYSPKFAKKIAQEIVTQAVGKQLLRSLTQRPSRPKIIRIKKPDAQLGNQ